MIEVQATKVRTWVQRGLIINLALIGCAQERIAAPIAPSVAASTSSHDLSVIPPEAMTPCAPNGYACGGAYPAIAPNPAVVNQYIIISPFDLGGWARTWSPGGYTGQMSMTGTADVTRGNTTRSGNETLIFPSCDRVGTECGGGAKSYHTCDVQRNSVTVSSTNAAVFANMTAWYDAFSDSRTCDTHSDDEYYPGGAEGGACPPENTYEWWHSDDGVNYYYVSDVCIDNGGIHRLSIGPRLGGAGPNVAEKRAAVSQGIGISNPSTLPANERVLLVRAEKLPPGLRSRLLRKGGERMIVVDATTTAVDVAQAIGTLSALRATSQDDGSDMSSDVRVVASGRFAPSAAASHYVSELQHVLDQFAQAPPSQLPGLGLVRIVELELPANPHLRSR